MRLVQARIVTDDVGHMAAFYAKLAKVPVTLNDYYVEVHAGPASVGFSKPRYTEYPPVSPAPAAGATGPSAREPRPEIILDFLTGDVDAEYERVKALGTECVLPPTTQPWGSRNMILRDPEGTLINVFSRRSRLT